VGTLLSMLKSSSPLRFAVETHGLTKRFGSHAVVDQLDLRVPVGALVGFIGPNGAGKTTTLRMLLGLIRPTSGTARVCGVPLSDPGGYLSRVGALIEGPAFYPGLSGERNLAVQATLAGIDPARIATVLDQVGLADRARSPYQTYSLGMKQRLGIAAALLGDPELVILDEPTNGLDPAGIRQMRGMLRSIRAEGRTVLVSSHLLAEIEQVCDWLIIISEGRLLFQGTAEELMSDGPDNRSGPAARGSLEDRYLDVVERGQALVGRQS
jgi:ABC-2 type transport system ATP-binding protein